MLGLGSGLGLGLEFESIGESIFLFKSQSETAVFYG